MSAVITASPLTGRVAVVTFIYTRRAPEGEQRTVGRISTEDLVLYGWPVDAVVIAAATGGVHLTGRTRPQPYPGRRPHVPGPVRDEQLHLHRPGRKRGWLTRSLSRRRQQHRLPTWLVR